MCFILYVLCIVFKRMPTQLVYQILCIRLYFDYNSRTGLGMCFPILTVGYKLFLKIIGKIATILLLTPTNRVQCIFIKK